MSKKQILITVSALTSFFIVAILVWGLNEKPTHEETYTFIGFEEQYKNDPITYVAYYQKDATYFELPITKDEYENAFIVYQTEEVDPQLLTKIEQPNIQTMTKPVTK